MKVAIGFKAHSGWAALIILGDDHGIGWVRGVGRRAYA